MKQIIGMLCLLVGILMFSTGYLAYYGFDSSVSLDHCRTNQEHDADRSELALKLLNDKWRGVAADDMVSRASQYEQQSFVTKSNDRYVSIGDFVFTISEAGRVDAVKSYSKMSSAELEALGL